MTIAVLFPGEGFEYPGMGRAMRDSAVWAYVDRATEVTGVETSALLLSEDAGERASVRETSIALIVVGVMAYERARDAGVRASWCGAYGVGRYAALVASGALDFESALKLALAHLDIWERFFTDTPFATVVLRCEGDLALHLWFEHSGADLSAVNSPREWVYTTSPEDANSLTRAAQGHGVEARRLNTWTGFCQAVPGDIFLEVELKLLLRRTEFQPVDSPIILAGHWPMALDDVAHMPDAFFSEVQGVMDWRRVAEALRLVGAEQFLLLAGDLHLLDVTYETLLLRDTDLSGAVASRPWFYADLLPLTPTLRPLDDLEFKRFDFQSLEGRRG